MVLLHRHSLHCARPWLTLSESSQPRGRHILSLQQLGHFDFLKVLVRKEDKRYIWRGSFPIENLNDKSKILFGFVSILLILMGSISIENRKGKSKINLDLLGSFPKRRNPKKLAYAAYCSGHTVIFSKRRKISSLCVHCAAAWSFKAATGSHK